MAVKTLLLKNAVSPIGGAHGSLQDAGAITTATTATGWVVGTTSATAYSLQTYATVKLAATFGGSAMPATSPITTDCWRSDGKYYLTFATGTWTVATSVISVTQGASGAGRITARIWRSANADGSSAVEITSGAISTGQWSNLTTATAQNLTGTQSIASFSLTGEYLFLQLAAEIDTASANAAANVTLRVDSTNSKVTTAGFTALSGSGIPTFTNIGSITRTRSSGMLYSIWYKMRARDPDCVSLTYRTWVVSGTPDYTAALYTGARCGATALTDITIVATWTTST